MLLTVPAFERHRAKESDAAVSRVVGSMGLPLDTEREGCSMMCAERANSMGSVGHCVLAKTPRWAANGKESGGAVVISRVVGSLGLHLYKREGCSRRGLTGINVPSFSDSRYLSQQQGTSPSIRALETVEAAGTLAVQSRVRAKTNSH